ncbi:MAG TPA: hypothetical protein VMU30_06410 [Bacteroidota bacterium]|nr:hypothetical protein [Bacteroidota bacterium]
MKFKTPLQYAILIFIFSLSGILTAQEREGSAFDQSKFVPDIAFILDVSGVARDITNEKYFSLSTPGYSYPGMQLMDPSGINAKRGWNFNYGEMSLYSVVDPYFDLFAVLDVSPVGASIEEAYTTTRKLPYGFQIKAGKFLASFGRVNEQHEHYWDFANRPLIATALFGEDGLNEVGAQVTWVAPTDFFLVLGAEVLNGENAASFGTAGLNDPLGHVAMNSVQGPNLLVNFVRASFDLDDAAILLGVSNVVGKTRTDMDFSSSGGTGEAVDANTDILGGDLTMKYTLDAIRFVSLQGEYMYRVMNGSEYVRDSANAVSSLSLDKHHSGMYAQLVAKLDQQWQAGVRYDLLMQNDVTLGGANQNLPTDLARYSAMIEFFPTEFSRLRLEIDRDESRYVQTSNGWNQQTYSQVSLQANFVIGAHGAHAF